MKRMRRDVGEQRPWWDLLKENEVFGVWRKGGNRQEQVENGRERFEGSSLPWCTCMYVLCMEFYGFLVYYSEMCS